MLNTKGKTTTPYLSLLKAYSVVLFLFFYLLGSSRIESFHGLFFQHNPPELHAPEQETDPCHRSIYHQELSGACEHSTHIIDNHKCAVCDSQCHSAQILEQTVIDIPASFTVASNTTVQYSAGTVFYSYSSSRAPPMI